MTKRPIHHAPTARQREREQNCHLITVLVCGLGIMAAVIWAGVSAAFRANHQKAQTHQETTR